MKPIKIDSNIVDYSVTKDEPVSSQTEAKTAEAVPAKPAEAVPTKPEAKASPVNETTVVELGETTTTPIQPERRRTIGEIDFDATMTGIAYSDYSGGEVQLKLWHATENPVVAACL